MRFGPSAWATVSSESPSRTPEAGRLVGQPGEPLQLRHRDAAQVERPLGPLGEPDDDQAEPVLAGLLVLFDEAALLERGEQPGRRRLVEPEPSGKLRDPGLALGVTERQQQGGRSIDRPDRVPVEHHLPAPLPRRLTSRRR